MRRRSRAVRFLCLFSRHRTDEYPRSPKRSKAKKLRAGSFRILRPLDLCASVMAHIISFLLLSWPATIDAAFCCCAYSRSCAWRFFLFWFSYLLFPLESSLMRALAPLGALASLPARLFRALKGAIFPSIVSSPNYGARLSALFRRDQAQIIIRNHYSASCRRSLSSSSSGCSSSISWRDIFPCHQSIVPGKREGLK